MEYTDEQQEENNDSAFDSIDFNYPIDWMHPFLSYKRC